MNQNLRVMGVFDTLRAYRAKNGMLSFAKFASLEADPCDMSQCNDALAVASFAKMILDGTLTIEDVTWSDEMAAQLEHVGRCPRCRGLTSAAPLDGQDEMINAAIERMKTDAHIPEDVRDFALKTFGKPKDATVN